MSKAFIIGNGESRRGFDLNRLKPYGETYGCNALYRDFHPDYLFSNDARMTKEIMGNKYPGTFYFTEGSFIHPFGTKLVKPSMLHMSGSIAAWIAICNDPKVTDIFLLGFDPVGKNKSSRDRYGRRNNMYNDTRNYPKSTASAEMMIRQVRKEVVTLVTMFPEHTLIRVGDRESIPNEWRKYRNLKFMTYPEFMK